MNTYNLNLISIMKIEKQILIYLFSEDLFSIIKFPILINQFINNFPEFISHILIFILLTIIDPFFIHTST